MNDTKLHGWRVVGLALTVIAASLIYVVTTYGWGEEGLRGTIRVTARTSFVIFLAAFSAASLAMLLPSRLTRWMLANRRFLGISFALSHIIHGAAIITLAVRTGGGSLTARVIGLSSAGFLYLFILFMLVTSFDRTAAWVGPRVWKRVHTIGSYLIFLSFLATYVRLLPQSLAYMPQVLILLAVWGFRLARRARRRRGAEAAPA